MPIKPLVLACLFALSPMGALDAQAQSSATATSPAKVANATDAKFRAIYTREWAWRQRQSGSAGEIGRAHV